MRVALTLLALAFAMRMPEAAAQITVPIAELARDANLVAVATVERATQIQGATAPDRTLALQLHLGQILVGHASSPTVIATLAEQCYMGGSGGGHTCIFTISGMVGLTGLVVAQGGRQRL